MKLRVLGSVALALVSVGCGPTDAPTTQGAVTTTHVRPVQTPLRITDVSVDRDRIDAAKGETSGVHYTIDAQAQVKLQIYEGRDALIFENTPVAVDKGDHKLEWDGKDATGTPVPSGAYQYVLSARNAKGSVIYDLTDLTGGEALIIPDVKWDPQIGKVTFRLTQPARINLRFGLNQGPYMRTVVDWVARDIGEQSIAWDGWDASHVINLAKHPLSAPTIRAYTLPQNTIFVGADVDALKFVAMKPLGMRQKTSKPEKTRMFFHTDQPLDTRGDVPVDLALVGNQRRDLEGRFIVSGVVPVRLNVPTSYRARVMERRFEPAFYTDGIFVFETEIGVLPITWQWDSTQVNNGEHYLTANIRGYEGNYGAATLRVWVQQPGQNKRAASIATNSEAMQ